MSWLEELEDLESTQEPLTEQNTTPDDWYPSGRTSIPRKFYVPYPDYASSKQTLNELSEIGEDVSEGIGLNERHWAISWFNPVNLQTLLEQNQFQPTPDDYQSLKDSLESMRKDGHNIESVKELLERTFANSQLQEGLKDLAHLDNLTNLLKGISPHTKEQGDRNYEK